MSSNEKTVPLIVDEQAVQSALPALDVRRALTQMFRELGSGNAVQPPHALSGLARPTSQAIHGSGSRARTRPRRR